MSIPVYILKRLLNLIPILIMVSILGFVIMRLSPTDPLAHLKLTPGITEETIQKEAKRLLLDEPLPYQYYAWATNFLKGNMGISTSGQNVSLIVIERAANTLMLVIITIFISWLIAIPLGIIAALKWRSTIDRLLTLLSSIGMAIPSFFFALLLLILAYKTGWFPIGGLTSVGFDKFTLDKKIIDIAHHLILPVVVISTIHVCGIQRQTRGNLLDVLESDYVKNG